MSTLHFNKANNNKLTAPAPSAMNGKFTVAVLFRPQGVDTPTLVSLGQQTDIPTFIIQNTGKIAMFYNSIRLGPSSFGTGWQIGVLSYDTANTPESWLSRFHLKFLDFPDFDWYHQDAENGPSVGVPTSAIGKTMSVGMAPGIGLNFDGDYGLLAWWEGVKLSDADVETLYTGLKTSNWAALSPSSLTEMTATTPIDLQELVTWTPSGAPTLTGEDPPGWTFDGLGPLPDPPPPPPELRIRASTGWLTVGGVGGSGSKGDTGDPGPPGPAGPAGLRGPAGEEGLVWGGEWDAAQTYQENDLIRYESDLWVALDSSEDTPPGGGLIFTTSVNHVFGAHDCVRVDTDPIPWSTAAGETYFWFEVKDYGDLIVHTEPSGSPIVRARLAYPTYDSAGTATSGGDLLIRSMPGTRFVLELADWGSIHEGTIWLETLDATLLPMPWDFVVDGGGEPGPPGPPGTGGMTEVYEQLTTPDTDTIGAIWIKQDI